MTADAHPPVISVMLAVPDATEQHRRDQPVQGLRQHAPTDRAEITPHAPG